MAAVLLGAAGAFKTITPAPATFALAQLTLKPPFWAVRLLGLIELTVATATLVLGGAVTAMALAVLYGGLTLVALAMLRLKPGTQCGCFGRVQMSISNRHVIVNLLALTAGSAAILWPVNTIDEMFTVNRWLYAPFAMVVVGGAYSAFAWLSQTPPQPKNPSPHQ